MLTLAAPPLTVASVEAQVWCMYCVLVCGGSAVPGSSVPGANGDAPYSPHPDCRELGLLVAVCWDVLRCFPAVVCAAVVCVCWVEDDTHCT
jgi:hypothetical protein